MYRNKNKETTLLKKHPWLWIVILAFGVWIISKMCSSGPDIDGAVFPGDNHYVEDAKIEDEIREGRYELDQIKNDPCLYDIYLGVPEGYRRCGHEEEEQYLLNDEYYDSESSSSSSCYCSSNRYNCSDFNTKREAQACYEKCLLTTGRDVHWLDDDDDGLACELNP